MAKYHELGRFSTNTNSTEPEVDWEAALFHEEYAAQLGVMEAILTLAKLYLGIQRDVLVNATVQVRGDNSVGEATDSTLTGFMVNHPPSIMLAKVVSVKYNPTPPNPLGGACFVHLSVAIHVWAITLNSFHQHAYTNDYVTRLVHFHTCHGYRIAFFSCVYFINWFDLFIRKNKWTIGVTLATVMVNRRFCLFSLQTRTSTKAWTTCVRQLMLGIEEPCCLWPGHLRQARVWAPTGKTGKFVCLYVECLSWALWQPILWQQSRQGQWIVSSFTRCIVVFGLSFKWQILKNNIVS